MKKSLEHLWVFFERLRQLLGIRKLYLFVLRSYMGPLVLTFFIAVFILLMQFLWKYVDDMVGKGFEWYVIGELLFYASATFVPLALPLAILLSSIMAFGNLGEHYELVAIKASGISFRRAMMPIVGFTVLLCVGAFYFSNNVLPIANLKFGTLLHDVREKKPALNISEGIFYNEIEGFVIRVGSKDNDGKTIRNVMIYDHTAEVGNINVTVAKTGVMAKSPDNRYLIFTLYDGYNYYEQVENRENLTTRPLQRTRFKQEYVRYDLSDFAMQRSNEDLFKDNYQMMNVSQIEESLDSLKIEFEARRQNFYRFLKQSFHYWAIMDSNVRAKPDSVALVKNDFITSFPREKRRTIVSNALTSARNVHQQLQYTEGEYKAKNEYLNRHNIEWHRKFSLSFACLVLFLIGAPLGAIIRRGGLGLPVVFATLFFIIFHVISMTGEKAAREGVWEAYQGMWLASAIFLPIGVLLSYSASTDAPLLDLEFWKIMFKRLLFWKRR